MGEEGGRREWKKTKQVPSPAQEVSDPGQQQETWQGPWGRAGGLLANFRRPPGSIVPGKAGL